MGQTKTSKKNKGRELPYGKWIALGVGVVLLIPVTALIWNALSDNGAQQSKEEAMQQEVADIEAIVSNAEEDPDYYDRTIGQLEDDMDTQSEPKTSKEKAEELQSTLDLAILYYQNGQYDKAIEAYEKVKTLIPKDDEDYEERIASYDLIIDGIEHYRDGSSD